jgi:hypothetical protein
MRTDIFSMYFFMLLSFTQAPWKVMTYREVVLTCEAKRHERTISLQTSRECMKCESLNSLASRLPFHLPFLLKLKVRVHLLM